MRYNMGQNGVIYIQSFLSFFLQMVDGSAFKLLEHEQYYVFVNICKRFKVLCNVEQFTLYYILYIVYMFHMRWIHRVKEM